MRSLTFSLILLLVVIVSVVLDEVDVVISQISVSVLFACPLSSTIVDVVFVGGAIKVSVNPTAVKLNAVSFAKDTALDKVNVEPFTAVT
jgi:hypothetical protein